jgi:hypothetical protein
MLQEIGAKIIGVVLNKADIRSGDYYFYNYDYKGYYSDDSDAPHRETILARVTK